MKKSLIIFVMAALAALSSAQSQSAPYTVYAQAKRESHLDTTALRNRGPGTYDVEYAGTNIFVVDGATATDDDSGQTLPWGMTWANLCNNQWTYDASDTVTMTQGQTLMQAHDYYTIDKNYGAGTANADPRNGDDEIDEDTQTWTRTCTSYVTNKVYWYKVTNV